MATQNFQRRLYLNLYRKGEKIYHVCFLLLPKSERKCPTRGSLTSPSYLVRNRTLGPPLENNPEISPSSSPSPGDLPNPGMKSRSSALQADSLLSEPPGKPSNTDVGTLSLLQGIFLTQESNQGLLLCRRILYQLSYQGSHVYICRC